MASRVQYAVSITPIVTMTSADAADHDSIGSDIGKSLGGSDSVATAAEAHTTVGYEAGVVAYGNAPVNGGAKLQLGEDAIDYIMVFIKHTGHQYSAPTVLGAVTTNNLVVYIETSGAMATFAKFTIEPGGAIVIPKIDLAALCGIWVESSSTETIAVEYALVL